MYYMNPKKQQGAVLAIALILLVPITIMAVTTMSLSVQGERMGANHKTQTQAFLAAEAGLQRTTQELYENWEDFTCAVGDVLYNEETFSQQTVYSVSVEECGSDDVLLRAEGLHTNSNASRIVEGWFRPPTGNNWTLPSGAPAPISCLGGPCEVTAGAGNNAVIDGRQHELPEEDCSGSGCWMSPISDEGAVPAVYLSDRLGSSVGSQGGGKKKAPYCGADLNNPDTVTCANSEDAASVWDPSQYPDNPDTGESTAPSVDGFFGNSPLFPKPQEASNEFGTRDDPKITYYDPSAPEPSGNDNNAGILVIDGDEYYRPGTGVFVGLVMVTNCGQIRMGGNFNIYGAIVVDASGCEEDYDPFAGNGTPSIRFTEEGLGLADQTVIPFLEGGLRSWREIIN